MKIIDFIRENKDWENILSEKPYALKITRDEFMGKKLVMLKYNQIDSNFNLEIVRECRGLILEEESFSPFCVPFFKFGNYGEGYVPEIDWSSSRVTEKIDGSLIKIVRSGDFLSVSTNGMIDAFKAEFQTQIGCDCKSFGELVLKAMNEHFGRSESSIHSYRDLFEEGWTYMFELVSPFTQVVVRWPKTELYFIGVRNISTMQEEFFGDHPLSKKFLTPKTYPLTTLDECVQASKELGENQEGFVVMDKFFNRVKIKSPVYVSLHHMRENGGLSLVRGVSVVLNGEVEEVLNYFPEYADHLKKIDADVKKLREDLEKAWEEFKKQDLQTRKEQAIFISKNFSIPSVGFSLLDGKSKSVIDWMREKDPADMAKMLGYK